LADSSASTALNSIPALLERNARKFGGRPAYREKEYGIWQSWTWFEAAEEIRAMALGFLALGVAEGDYVAIIGRNRPALYWSMVASQMVGAIPVPLYQDAVAEEMAYVLSHCGARFVIENPNATSSCGCSRRTASGSASMRKSSLITERRPAKVLTHA